MLEEPRSGGRHGPILWRAAPEYFLVGVPGAQAQHAFGAPFVGTFGAGERELADLERRVGIAAPVAERLALGAAADLVDIAVSDAHDMEGLSDLAGVIEMRRQPGTERLGQVGGDHLDPRQPVGVGAGGPSPQVNDTVALDHVDEHAAQVNQTGRVARGVMAARLEKRRLVGTEMADLPDAGGSSTSGVPCSTTAFMTVHQHTPNSSASRATERASSPTCRHTSAPPRRVSTAWAPKSGESRSRSSPHTAVPPPPLVPDQPGGPIEARHVTHVHRRPVLGLSSHPATRPAHHGGRLDLDDHLDRASSHAQHLEPVQAQHLPGHRGAVAHAVVSSSLLPSNSCDDGGTPAPSGGSPGYLTPHSDA